MLFRETYNFTVELWDQRDLGLDLEIPVELFQILKDDAMREES